MPSDFSALQSAAEAQYSGAYVAAGEQAFLLALPDGPVLTFAFEPGEPATVVVRTMVLDLGDVSRAGEFAKSAPADAHGATFSAGADGALYLTARRPVDELADAESLAACVGDFTRTVAEWQGRGSLYT